MTDAADKRRSEELRANLECIVIIALPGIVLNLDPAIADAVNFGRPSFLGGLRIIVFSQWVLQSLMAIGYLKYLRVRLPLREPQSAVAASVIGATFAAGAVYAVVIGLVLLPLSIFSLLLGVGLFGAVPFVVAVVLATRARELLTWAARYRTRAVVAAGLVSGLCTLAIPLAAHWSINRWIETQVEVVLAGNDAEATQAMKALYPWRRAVDLRRIPETAAQLPPGTLRDRLDAATAKLEVKPLTAFPQQ